jgi:hypothetical protein
MRWLVANAKGLLLSSKTVQLMDDFMLWAAKFLSSGGNARAVFLTVEHAVDDWTCLGLFTGSHVSEYAQTCLKAGIRYNIIPDMPDAGL